MDDAQVAFEDLNGALKQVVSDAPGAFLKPFVAGGAPQALLAKAAGVLEAREREQLSLKQIGTTRASIEALEANAINDDEVLATLAVVKSSLAEVRADVEKNAAPAAILDQISDLDERFQLAGRRLVMMEIASDFASAAATWCDEVRSSGASEIMLDPPGAMEVAEDGSARKALLGTLANVLSPRMLEECGICYDAQVAFANLTSSAQRPALESAKLLRQVKSDIIAHRKLLQDVFLVMLPDDFEQLVAQVFGKDVQAEWVTTARSFSEMIFPVLVKGEAASGAEKRILDASTHVQRLLTSEVIALGTKPDGSAETPSEYVVVLLAMVGVATASSKLARIAADLELKPLDSARALKILDASSNALLMTVRGQWNGVDLSPEKVDETMGWACRVVDDGGGNSAELLEGSPPGPWGAIVAAKLKEVESLYDSRVAAVTEIMQKVSSSLADMKAALPDLQDTPDSMTAFTKAAFDASLIKNAEVALKEFTKAKAAALQIGIGDHVYSPTENELGFVRGRVACVSAICPLQNPKITSKDKKGRALQKQLEAVGKLIAQNTKTYDSAVPKWLVGRIKVAESM
ncbi:unnamed protein product [Prorocentrum cordatum]|uniref:Uncharacterized protein n=1 Tax=Prorocentrum cordatum TaxID=2364126 RepID=A0ABN9Y036_9DINO|nr:unnamed protein product [Polarella glacialis]